MSHIYLHPFFIVLLSIVYPTIFAYSFNLTVVESWLKSNEQTHLQNLIDFVSIPSVSADPTRVADVRRCAEWLKKELIDAGLQNVRIIETPTHPTVYADWLFAKHPNAPTVLIYGHYDVQPEDPVDLWTTPPFKPSLRNGKLYGRGASDDKGPMYVPIIAIKAYLKTIGQLPVNVRLLFEGEEEVGSPHLRDTLVRYGKDFAADYAFGADGGMVSPTIPSLNLGLRGTYSMEVTVRTAKHDMHSGAFGGGVQNPIHALAQLLATLRDVESGRILVKGYYEDVDPVTEEERQIAKEYPVPVEKALHTVGANESVGEAGYSFYERTWYRPSLEIVGIWGGFTGEGIKTVLPKEAHAKISGRIVTSQDPIATQELVRQHLEAEAEKIPGVAVEIRTTSFNSKACKASKDTGGSKVAARVLTDLYGRMPVYTSMGGTIPVMCMLTELLNVEATMFAFAHGDENVHAPNEYGRIEAFRRGEVGYVRLFHELAKEHGIVEEGQVEEEVGEEKGEL